MVILHDILNLFVTTNTDNEIPSFIWFVSPILQSSMHLEFPQIVEVWKIFISLLYTSVYFLPWFHFVKLLRFLFISLAMVSLMRSQTRTSFYLAGASWTMTSFGSSCMLARRLNVAFFFQNLEQIYFNSSSNGALEEPNVLNVKNHTAKRHAWINSIICWPFHETIRCSLLGNIRCSKAQWKRILMSVEHTPQIGYHELH